MRPKVSVLMPVYNSGPFLKAAIESVLAQTYLDFEFIIINDGSTDESKQVIKSFTDDRIRYIENENNIGIIKSRNKGLQLAQGVYIANMDSDDISLPTRLEKQIHYLEQHPEVSILATKLILINENDIEIGFWPEDIKCISSKQIKKTLPIINCVGQPTVMMRADVVKQIGYNENFIHNEDWGLWLEALSKGKQIEKLDEFLLKYRIHSSSITVKTNSKGVEKKIIRFKYSYFKSKIFKTSLKVTDYKVFFSIFINVFRLFIKTIFPWYYLLSMANFKNFIKLFKQFLKVKKMLSSIEKPISNIFIFPYYHVGGAEKVHASILEALNQNNSITFITEQSSGNLFLNNFQSFSIVIEINYLLKLGYTKRWLIKKINSVCSSPKPVVIFGCNSSFFYDLIPHLSTQIKFIDLIHAFVHTHEKGPEKWSLPVVSRIDTRIVINNRTKTDFEQFYKLHKVDESLLSRIICISNFVEYKPFIPQDEKEKLKILYVGRGTPEKRVHLIAKIAYELFNNGINVEFHFVGNVKDSIPVEYLKFCILHGELTDEKAINEIYSKSNILIVASSREGFPMVIMEAMVHGVVPISTNVGGISEHVKHEDNGILIYKTDEIEIVNQFVKTISFYSMHRTELMKMAVNANKYAAQNFSKENFYSEYLRLLKN